MLTEVETQQEDRLRRTYPALTEAAPALLAACRVALRELDEREGRFAPASAARVQLRLAIARAELGGRAPEC